MDFIKLNWIGKDKDGWVLVAINEIESVLCQVDHHGKEGTSIIFLKTGKEIEVHESIEVIQRLIDKGEE